MLFHKLYFVLLQTVFIHALANYIHVLSCKLYPCSILQTVYVLLQIVSVLLQTVSMLFSLQRWALNYGLIVRGADIDLRLRFNLGSS